MRKLSTVQNGGFPNVFSFHIIHYPLFSSLKNICNKKDFHVARQTCWWKRPFHVGWQDKKGPGKIHEVIFVLYTKQNKSGSESSVSCLKQGSEMSNFCLTQGQGLKALGAPPLPKLPLSAPPPGSNKHSIYHKILIVSRLSGFQTY